MVRCEEFYKYFEKKGNFCRKSEGIVKQVESYISYVKRHKLGNFGGYRISNSALDTFMNIEDIKGGKVHDIALKELKDMIRKKNILPEKVTRRVSVEIINRANMKVDKTQKLEKIPNIRSTMGYFEHEIRQIGFDVRKTFDGLKEDVGAKNNNELLKLMVEICIRNLEDIRKLKEEMDIKDDTRHMIKIISSQ